MGIAAVLIEGDDGVFDVAVNGKVIFSKSERGSFIGTPEVVDLVRNACRPHSD